MEELHPSSSFAVRLEEVMQPVGTDNQQLSAGGKKQNSLLGMAASSLSAADDMLRSIMKSALYQTTGRTQSASRSGARHFVLVNTTESMPSTS